MQQTKPGSWTPYKTVAVVVMTIGLVLCAAFCLLAILYGPAVLELIRFVNEFDGSDPAFPE